jgi:hypothetical protein
MRSRFLVFILILLSWLPAEVTKTKQALLNHTLPMPNLYKDYEKHTGIALKNLSVGENFILIKKEGREYQYFFDVPGANFSDSDRLTEKVNLYTLFNRVYYIEAQKFSENYSLFLMAGSHFFKDDNIFSINLSMDYWLNQKSKIGININDYTDYGQSNAALFYSYKISEIFDVKTGIELHYLRKKHLLSDLFSFPNDKKDYDLENSFYPSFFIDPGIVFKSGRFTIRQGITARFFIVTGNVTGLAWHLQPAIKIGYRIF